jgi:hypothetical protein
VLRAYGTAVGPLFYMLYADLTAPFGYSYVTTRLLSVICGLVCLCAMRRIARDLDLPSSRLPLFVLVSPYFFTLSMLLMSDTLGLAFMLVAIALTLPALQRGRLAAWQVAAATLATVAAEYVRQYYLAIAVSMAVLGIVGLRRIAGASTVMAIGLISAALLLPIFVLWHGLVPANAVITARHSISLASAANLVNLNLALCWLGLYASPIALAFTRRVTRRLVLSFAVVVVLLLPLFLLWRPSAFGNERLLGLYSSAMILAHVPHSLRSVIVLASWVAGVGVLALAIDRLWTLRTAIHVLLATMMASQIFAIVLMTGQATERYILAVPPLAAMYFARNEDPLANRRGKVVLVGQASIAIIYFVSKVSSLVAG